MSMSSVRMNVRSAFILVLLVIVFTFTVATL